MWTGFGRTSWYLGASSPSEEEGRADSPYAFARFRVRPRNLGLSGFLAIFVAGVSR
jgi:hypothetical protein